MENTPALASQRLTYSRFTTADAPAMYAGWANSEAVCRNLFLKPGKTLEQCETELRQLEEQYESETDVFHWAIRENGTAVGVIFLRVNRRHVSGELAYYLAERAWGKGYMTEALRRILQFGFDELGLNRMAADHFAENPASGGVMKKAGMQYEGTERQKYCKDGVFHDAVCYAALKSDPRT